jgi:hypothetical protein
LLSCAPPPDRNGRGDTNPTCGFCLSPRIICSYGKDFLMPRGVYRNGRAEYRHFVTGVDVNWKRPGRRKRHRATLADVSASGLSFQTQIHTPPPVGSRIELFVRRTPHALPCRIVAIRHQDDGLVTIACRRLDADEAGPTVRDLVQDVAPDPEVKQRRQLPHAA